MKTDIRIALPPMNEGSSTSVIITILPSAGETTIVSPRSPVRSGSRKKYATQSASTVSTNASSHSVHDLRARAKAYAVAASAEAMPMKTSPSRAKFIYSKGRKRVAREALEYLEIAAAHRINDIGRKRRGRWIAVPAAGGLFPLQMIAQRLLVETGRRSAFLVSVRGPEARAVGG